uniref:Uncharacterized protein n=1 Tax=Chromera velia CCMP2878 TaxID=1169474 RepID=A0A0G4GA58_9ALVE|eukprot:Cvel_20844.t1-p1 / transcript=Cvel_20844.t1 / gene=Cvel_20844 / organism=Chromera_velia_CCMP2878 / gene_product=hypothetical protein / transcript_product=hypothetical protein / location=Cvel_scaffold1909:4088-6802(+) / protein_length=348 / sequence_SO=supercontig / SO=protein_coding / is_pseudo=false
MKGRSSGRSKFQEKKALNSSADPNDSAAFVGVCSEWSGMRVNGLHGAAASYSLFPKDSSLRSTVNMENFKNVSGFSIMDKGKWVEGKAEPRGIEEDRLTSVRGSYVLHFERGTGKMWLFSPGSPAPMNLSSSNGTAHIVVALKGFLEVSIKEVFDIPIESVILAPGNRQRSDLSRWLLDLHMRPGGRLFRFRELLKTFTETVKRRVKQSANQSQSFSFDPTRCVNIENCSDVATHRRNLSIAPSGFKYVAITVGGIPGWLTGKRREQENIVNAVKKLRTTTSTNEFSPEAVISSPLDVGDLEQRVDDPTLNEILWSGKPVLAGIVLVPVYASESMLSAFLLSVQGTTA